MNVCICIGQTNMVKGFKKGGKFRPFRRKGKSGKEKSLELQKQEFNEVDIARGDGVDFAFKKGRLRGSKTQALANVEETIETQEQAGVPTELTKINRKILLNEVKREFGVSALE